LLASAFRSDYLTEAHVVREQPVPFSHKHHVGGSGSTVGTVTHPSRTHQLTASHPPKPV
jgi:hypothetical protein